MSNTPITNSTSELTKRMLVWQVSATIIVALLAALIKSIDAGLSAAMGGMSVIFAAFVASKIAERGDHMQQPGAVLVNMLKAEAVKILIIAVFLFVIFKLYQALVPFALVAGLAGAALFSGAALAKSQASV